MRPAGIGDVAAVACRDTLGCWGWIEAYRDGSDRRFEAGDLELLASVGPSLGSALRRGLMVASTSPLGPSRPGVIVLNPELTPVSSTAGARAWIDILPGAALFAGWAMLPAQVYPVATMARSRKSVTGAHALERAVDGRWVMIEAALLEGDCDGQIAITLRSTTPTETFDLLCRAYAFTRRERDVAAAVVAGLDTRALTEHLFISRHTVQDHLKSIFQKTGIHSRRQLLARFNDSPDGL